MLARLGEVLDNAPEKLERESLVTEDGAWDVHLHFVEQFVQAAEHLFLARRADADVVFDAQMEFRGEDSRLVDAELVGGTHPGTSVRLVEAFRLQNLEELVDALTGLYFCRRWLRRSLAQGGL